MRNTKINTFSHEKAQIKLLICIYLFIYDECINPAMKQQYLTKIELVRKALNLYTFVQSWQHRWSELGGLEQIQI